MYVHPITLPYLVYIVIVENKYYSSSNSSLGNFKMSFQTGKLNLTKQN